MGARASAVNCFILLLLSVVSKMGVEGTNQEENIEVSIGIYFYSCYLM